MARASPPGGARPSRCQYGTQRLRMRSCAIRPRASTPFTAERSALAAAVPASCSWFKSSKSTARFAPSPAANQMATGASHHQHRAAAAPPIAANALG
jgi:hypothetical protein